MHQPLNVTCAKLLMALLLIVHVHSHAAEAPAKLAVIAETTAAATAVDVLTAELTPRADLQLLERAEVQRIYQEQALSAGNRDFIKLGQLLGADGLLFLQVIKEGTNQFLQAQLVAVKPGVVIGDTRAPWPLGDITGWAGITVKRFEPLYPKLSVLLKDALPVSIVNIRAAIQSPQEQELEQQLTSLLIARLTHEPELFVLERRRMDSLSGEKEMKGIGESSFWNGSYLIDGTLDRDGYSQERATANIRLTPPKGVTPVNVEAAAPRSDVAVLVDQTAQKILQALHRSPTTEEWNTTEEAAKYFEEAKWALRWQMFDEARSASETAWVLGLQTQELAEIRIRATLALGSDRRRNSSSTLGITFEATPDASRLPAMLRALELFTADYRRYIVPVTNRPVAWNDLGADLLDTATVWLQHYYEMPETREGQESQLTELRNRCRETVDLLVMYPVSSNLFGGRSASAKNVSSGAYWQETPEQCIDIYRNLEASGQLWRLRESFIQDPLTGSLLVGWRWSDRVRAPKIWKQFVEELCNSTNTPTRIDGLFLRAGTASTDGDSSDALKELCVLLVQDQGHYFAAKPEDKLLEDMKLIVHGHDRFTVNPYFKPVTKKVWAEYEPQIKELAKKAQRSAWEQEFDRRLKTDQENAAKRTEEFKLKRRELIERFKSQLRGQTNVDAATMRKLVSIRYSKAEADEVLIALKDYDTYLRKTEANSLGDDSPIHAAQLLAVHLQNIIEGKATFTNNVLPRPQFPNPATQARTGIALPQASGPELSELPVTPLLRVGTFWSVPSLLPNSEAVPAPEIKQMYYHQGKVWAMVKYECPDEDEFGGSAIFGGSCCAFFCVDSKSLKTDVFPAGNTRVVIARSPNYMQVQLDPAMRTFDVWHERLFVSFGGSFRVCNLKDKSWATLSMPFDGFARVITLGERLFVTTKDGIFEVQGDGSDVRIIASIRRNPPETVLDSLTEFNWPTLWLGTNGDIHTLIGQVFYVLPRGNKDWRQVGSLPGTRPIPEGGLIGLSAGTLSDSYLLAPISNPPGFEHLITDRRGISFVNRTNDLSQDLNSSSPKWLLPASIEKTLSPRVKVGPTIAAYDGTRLWLLASHPTFENSKDFSSLKVTDGRHALLLCYEPTNPTPAVIPLWFELPSAVSKSIRKPSPPWTSASIMATPAGLLIGYPHLPGFWFIPQSELDSRLASRGNTAGESETKGTGEPSRQKHEGASRTDANSTVLKP